MKKSIEKEMDDFFATLFKEPKVIKTYPIKPVWKAEFKKLENMAKEKIKLSNAIEIGAAKLWKAIEKDLKEKRHMHRNPKKNIIEVLE